MNRSQVSQAVMEMSAICKKYGVALEGRGDLIHFVEQPKPFKPIIISDIHKNVVVNQLYNTNDEITVAVIG